MKYWTNLHKIRDLKSCADRKNAENTLECAVAKRKHQGLHGFSNKTCRDAFSILMQTLMQGRSGRLPRKTRLQRHGLQQKQ